MVAVQLPRMLVPRETLAFIMCESIRASADRAYAGAVSSTQRSDLSIFFRGSPIAKGHPWPPIERILDRQDIVLRVQRKIGAEAPRF